eukprot:CAMPEP_0174316890 /NCGR_PEP_ID=MMETSP0810-20121108/7257_1 /TAXON_ID=73025 ORGANISM="Eutreptiella gymnastica-like, Strain CCMP1594" /NCGR_SAMPLE_ID=MMETSP0810 /ASSEMBLY_ACC=CAM_ASM_000659 /LENGTH=125 /DNA_ID=CAMNT_0015426765 /DNA_START=280 /DNA_END=657 /DNA_ORIENTATION=+
MKPLFFRNEWNAKKPLRSRIARPLTGLKFEPGADQPRPNFMSVGWTPSGALSSLGPRLKERAQPGPSNPYCGGKGFVTTASGSPNHFPHRRDEPAFAVLPCGLRTKLTVTVWEGTGGGPPPQAQA